MHRRQAIGALTGATLFHARAANLRPLPDPSLAEHSPEKYWSRIRADQFLLPNWRAFLNNGSLGVAPKPVLRAVQDFLERAARLEMAESDYPRWGYETLDEHRAEMAAFLGCKKEELAFTHNATEALGTIAAGIDLREGDEVVMTDQEHTSGRSGWLLKQARFKISVREVQLPLPPPSSANLTDLLVSSIGPRTRVLFFSGITSPTGLILPVREICDAARAKGVITVVDGAHINGQIPVRLNDLGCDYYAASPHKWMFAPAGCGFLYGREEMLDRLWPTIVTGRWDSKDLKAARFMMVGTNNRATVEGMIAGLRFLNSIGAGRIYARIHELAKMARKLASESSHCELLTPGNDGQYGSLIAFRLRGVKPERLMDLCSKRRIWISGGPRIRLSTHIHTRPSDLDLFFETLRAAA
jgi:isopenicillin-N epimerase